MFRKIRSWWRSFTRKKPKPDHRTPTDDHVDHIKVPTESDYKIWVPWAENVYATEGIKQRTRYEYAGGFMKGLVVHWTSGWALPPGNLWRKFPQYNNKEKLDKLARKQAIQAIKSSVDRGHCYFVMDVLGRVYQSRPCTKGGYHAGTSSWPSVGRSVSREFGGMEILNPGKLEKKGDRYFTWFKQEIPKDLVRYIEKDTDNMAKGYYAMYSLEQEESLDRFCKTLKQMSPPNVFEYDNVVGHDEVSPNRKTDPGGSLSVSMKDFRKKLF